MAKRVPPEPPYRWRPLGTVSVNLPEAGQLIAWRHAAWRVFDVVRWPEADWPDGLAARLASARARVASGEIRPFNVDGLIPRHVWIRPASFVSNGDPVRDRRFAVSLSSHSSFRAWEVYPSDHYPVCAECGEPSPCRAEMARELGTRAEKAAAKFEIAGVCPACQEIPTTRHKVVTFAENLRVPLGPPVTFHVGRRECRYEAYRYEQEVARACPGYELILSCPGTTTRHPYDPYDRRGPAECTEGASCRGPKMPHAGQVSCGRDCSRCQGVRDSRAEATVTRNAAGDWTTW